MRMVKIAVIALVGMLLLAGGTYAYLRGKRYHIEITQSQIDAGLTKIFPKSKGFLVFLSITYSNPEVTLLEENDRIRVGMDVTVSIRIDGEEKQLGGSCTATSGIAYDPETQALYLSDAKIEKLVIQGIPTEHIEKVTRGRRYAG